MDSGWHIACQTKKFTLSFWRRAATYTGTRPIRELRGREVIKSYPVATTWCLAFLCTYTHVVYQKILSPINEASVTLRSLRSCEKLTHICCLSRQSYTISGWCRGIYLCLCINPDSHGNNQPQILFSIFTALCLHHQGLVMCSFSDIWRLSGLCAVVRRAVDWSRLSEMTEIERYLEQKNATAHREQCRRETWFRKGTWSSSQVWKTCSWQRTHEKCSVHLLVVLLEGWMSLSHFVIMAEAQQQLRCINFCTNTDSWSPDFEFFADIRTLPVITQRSWHIFVDLSLIRNLLWKLSGKEN